MYLLEQSQIQGLTSGFYLFLQSGISEKNYYHYYNTIERLSSVSLHLSF